MRNKLPVRRPAITRATTHINSRGDTEKYFLTFGFDAEGQIREVFCANPMKGSDMEALLTDACILISIYLQTGGEPERLIASLGQNRKAGEHTGAPSSVIGSIAHAILNLHNELDKVE